MAGTEHVLEQMRVANPAPSLEQLEVDALDLVRDLVARRRFVMVTPVKERRERVHPEPPTRRRRTRPVLVVGLAGMLVLGTLGLALMFLSGGDDAAPAGPANTLARSLSEDVTDPLQPTDVPVTSMAQVPVIGSEWTLVSVDDSVFGPGAVTNVIATPDGFLAVGAQGARCPYDGCRAAVWRSPDGVEWTRLYVDPAENDPPDPEGPGGATGTIGTWFHDAAMNDHGYLAVGATDGAWGIEPVIAMSADGRTWERIQQDGVVIGLTSTRLSVVATEDMFLLAGQSCEDDCTGVVWRSEDGVVWTKVLEDVRNSAFESVDLVSDRYLAVGGAGIGGDEVVRIWSSFDGLTWSDVSADPLVFGTGRPDSGAREYARAAAAVDSGFIVAGSQFDVPEGAMWFSEDATTWVRLATDGVFRGAAISGLVGSGDRLIAVGALGGGPDLLAMAWRSDDGGMTWERMDVDPALTGGNSQFLNIAIRGDTVAAALSVSESTTYGMQRVLGDGRPAIVVIRLGGTG
jgi:hypothetical protein